MVHVQARVRRSLAWQAEGVIGSGQGVVGQFDYGGARGAGLLGAGILRSTFCDTRIVGELKIGLSLGPRNAGFAAVHRAVRWNHAYQTKRWLGLLFARSRRSLFARGKRNGQGREQNGNCASMHDGKLERSLVRIRGIIYLTSTAALCGRRVEVDIKSRDLAVPCYDEIHTGVLGRFAFRPEPHASRPELCRTWGAP